MKKVKGILSGTRILCRDKNIIGKYIFLGNEAKNTVGFSIIEGIYLVEKGILEVYDKENKILKFEELLERGIKITNDKDFYAKYLVFRNLSNKGYLVATGLKFGADFRVYTKDKENEQKTNEKNVNNEENLRKHSKFLVKVVPEEYVASFPEMVGALRLTKAVNKTLIYAVVDKDGDVIYYTFDLAKI